MSSYQRDFNFQNYLLMKTIKKLTLIVLWLISWYTISFAEEQLLPFTADETTIFEFCNTIFNTADPTIMKGNMILDPKNSFFIQGLCNSLTYLQQDMITVPLQDNFVQRIGLEQYESWNKNRNVCNGRLWQCRYTEYAEKLYRSIMSDIFKIKRSYVAYGNESNEKMSDKVERIMNLSRFEVMKKEYSILKKEFPQTVNIIEKNNKFFEKMREDLTIIDLQKLNTGTLYNALYGDENGINNNTDFTNLLYNELLRYNLFNMYYINILENVIKDSKQEDIKTEMMIEQDIAWENIQNSKEILDDAINNLLEFARTYQIHIALLAYQETLLDSRNNYLAKLVTPLYTLYDKLRNVQPI